MAFAFYATVLISFFGVTDACISFKEGWYYRGENCGFFNDKFNELFRPIIDRGYKCGENCPKLWMESVMAVRKELEEKYQLPHVVSSPYTNHPFRPTFLFAKTFRSPGRCRAIRKKCWSMWCRGGPIKEKLCDSLQTAPNKFDPNEKRVSLEINGRYGWPKFPNFPKPKCVNEDIKKVIEDVVKPNPCMKDDISNKYCPQIQSQLEEIAKQAAVKFGGHWYVSGNAGEFASYTAYTYCQTIIERAFYTAIQVGLDKKGVRPKRRDEIEIYTAEDDQ